MAVCQFDRMHGIAHHLLSQAVGEATADNFVAEAEEEVQRDGDDLPRCDGDKGGVLLGVGADRVGEEARTRGLRRG